MKRGFLLALVLLLPLVSCAPVYRCVPGSEFLACPTVKK